MLRSVAGDSAACFDLDFLFFTCRIPSASEDKPSVMRKYFDIKFGDIFCDKIIEVNHIMGYWWPGTHPKFQQTFNVI